LVWAPPREWDGLEDDPKPLKVLIESVSYWSETGLLGLDSLHKTGRKTGRAHKFCVNRDV